MDHDVLIVTAAFVAMALGHIVSSYLYEVVGPQLRFGHIMRIAVPRPWGAHVFDVGLTRLSGRDMARDVSTALTTALAALDKMDAESPQTEENDDDRSTHAT